MLLKLPIGIQSYEQIRTGGYVYVDKTRYIASMLDQGKSFFLSRPRRFGKSLTVSTFQAIFEGKRELFEGAWIGEHWDFRPHPVISLDMSELYAPDEETLILSLSEKIRREAARQGVSLESTVFTNAFAELIEKVSKRGEVAVLVDEYDKPILDNLRDLKAASMVRDVLRSFYGILKSADAHLRFVFLTGISTLSKVSVFSSLNNLKDISLSGAYGTMLGYTQEEIEHYFGGHIINSAAKHGISKNELIDRLREHYDGFSFDGQTRVYNPFSILNFFFDGRFRNYWFESGSPGFLVRYARERGLSLESLSRVMLDRDFPNIYEIEEAPPENLLWQAGYLTIKEAGERSYTLDFPNREVQESFNRLLLIGPYELPAKDAARLHESLWQAFDGNNFDEVMSVFRRAFSSIPYTLFSGEESYYHSVLLMLLLGTGIDARAEEMTSLGRSDLVVEHKGRVFVIELKRDSSAAALQQIRTKGYGEKYRGRELYLVGIKIDEEKRNLGEYRLEKVNSRW